MTTANESKLGGARGGHRGPIILRVAAARVLPLLPVAARGARLVLSMGLAAGCVRARSSSSPLRGGHCPPLAASTSRLEVWLRCRVRVGCGTPLFRRVVGCRRPARVREGHAEARRRVAGSALHRAWRGRRGEAEAAGGCTRCWLVRRSAGRWREARSSAPNSRRDRRRPARRSRRPLPPYARSLPAPARESHLISNRPNSRFDQFQLPMTSFVCSCHWPPNRFVTCARRSLRSHAT